MHRLTKASLADPYNIAGRAPVTWTYFILCRHAGMVKIGRSRHMLKRFATIAASSPHPICLAAATPRDCELELHRKFGNLREHGEWFRVNPKLAAFVLSLPEAVSVSALCRSRRHVINPHLRPQQQVRDLTFRLGKAAETDENVQEAMRLVRLGREWMKRWVITKPAGHAEPIGGER